jgi:hypothetical protein
VRVNSILNPNVTGPTNAFQLQVVASDWSVKASTQTNTRINILATISNQSECN